MAKIILACIIFFTGSVHANSEYFFQSAGKEVKFTFSGSYLSPSSILFEQECNPSYCDISAQSRTLLRDFFNAVKTDKVYYYIEENTGQCIPGQICNQILKTPANGNSNNNQLSTNLNDEFPFDMLRNKTKTKMNAKDFADTVVKGIGTEIGSQAVQGMVNYVMSSAGANIPVSFSVLLSEEGKPIKMCRMGAYGCTVIEEVTFHSSFQELSASLEEYDFNDSLDVVTERALGDYVRSFASSNFSGTARCRRVFTGPPESQTMQISCWKTY